MFSKPPVGESVSSRPGPTVEACYRRGHTLTGYKLFSAADLDITSPLPDYIDICFYYLLICASRNNSFLLFYRKQHCKVSVLNHNYLPLQFMHLCPLGIWWRAFTGTSGYFSPTVSCYWCFCLLVIFFFFTHSVSQGKKQTGTWQWSPSWDLFWGPHRCVFCEGLSPLTRPDAVGLCGRTIGYHSFALSVFPRASDGYLSERASVTETPQAWKRLSWDKIWMETRDSLVRCNWFLRSLKHWYPTFTFSPGKQLISSLTGLWVLLSWSRKLNFQNSDTQEILSLFVSLL